MIIGFGVGVNDRFESFYFYQTVLKTMFSLSLSLSFFIFNIDYSTEPAAVRL